MQSKILSSLTNPEALERLYREDKTAFTEALMLIAEDNGSDLIRFWKLRLQPEPVKEVTGIFKTDLIVAAAICLITGFLSRLPGIFGNPDQEFFYIRNIGIIVFAGLILYTLWQKRIADIRKILTVTIPVVFLALFLNLLPGNMAEKRDSVLLACLHGPLFLWCLFGLVWCDFDTTNHEPVFRFIRYNGELITMTGLIMIAGGILSAMTISLFAMIGMDIAEFYMENIALAGAAASPVVAAWLIGQYPAITRKISPVIARVFTPLVLVSSIVYLVALVISGIDVSENREFLVMFNLLLLAVMAIIIFSVTELDRSKVRNLNLLMLLLLTIVTLIINVIALVAIINRLTEGFTPNRTVVLLSNILVFIHLLLLLPGLYSAWFRHKSLDTVEKRVTRYLPVYFFYTLFVIFILPFLFRLN